MKQKRTVRSDTPIHWLPIDSRFINPLFSFGHVRGIAKVFLTIEMTLAAGVVTGTLLLVVLRLVP